MKSTLILTGFALAALTFLSPKPAAAATIYNNLNSVTDGTDGVASFGPLADSFSTGNSGFSLASVGLKLSATNPADGNSITVALLSDDSTSPGSLLYTIGTIDDSSLTTAAANYSIDLGSSFYLAPNSRYWIQLSQADGTANWAWSLDQAAQGVAGEYFANTGNVFPNDGGPYQMQLSGTSSVAVAEPDTFWLVALGLAGCLWFGRKRIAI